MRSFSIGWLPWIAVAFFLFGMGLPREDYRRVERALDDGQWPGVLNAVRAYLTNDGDVRRYHAYAEAAQGHSYASYYVRTEAAWRESFRAAESFRPDEWPTLAPERRLVPYRDYLVEYPPGFFLAALPPTWVASTPDGYVKLFEVFMALALTGALALMTRSIRRLGGRQPSIGKVLAWASLCVLLLGTVATHRYDASVALAMTVALAALVADRPLLLGAALGAAIALKATPVLILPIVLLHGLAGRRYREILTILLAAIAVPVLLTVPTLLGGGDPIGTFLQYHVDRPVQIESTWGGLAGLIHSLGLADARVQWSFGSVNLVGKLPSVLARLASAATVVGLVLVYLVAWRRMSAATESDRKRIALESSMAALAVFVACGKVASPQYLVWILPVGLLLSLTNPRRLGLILFIACLALCQVIYPMFYGAISALKPFPFVFVLARNLTLLTWGVLLLRTPTRTRANCAAGSGSYAVLPRS